VGIVPSIAIESYLVKAEPGIPEGFEYLRATLSGGVPSEIVLGDSWRLLVAVPTGVARLWLDADPQSVVSSSDDEQRPFSASDRRRPPAPARMIVTRAGALLGAIPFTSGVRTRMTSDTPSPSLLEVVPLSWDIRVAGLVGGATATIRIELAWRAQFIATLSG
jgi:hypothetical protein